MKIKNIFKILGIISSFRRFQVRRSSKKS